MDLIELRDKLRSFASERDWEQFHTPKNLAMALSGEVGELNEIFQWLTDKQSSEIANDPTKLQHTREEIADIQLYLIRLADKLNIDIAEAASEKIDINKSKYPIDKSHGSAKKYTEL